jgi:hypothetical protein
VAQLRSPVRYSSSRFATQFDDEDDDISPADNSSPLEIPEMDKPAHIRSGAYALDFNSHSSSDIRALHRVSDATLARFPPTGDRANQLGWSQKQWYVVGRGYDFGIFFDYWWAHIHST